MHSGRKRLQLLMEDGGRGFDQNARLLFRVAVKLIEKQMQAPPTLLFKRRRISRRQMPQMSEDILFICQAVFTEPPADERLQDLLSAAAPHAEHKLERSPVDEGIRQLFELPNDIVEAIVPERFIGQRSPQTLCTRQSACRLARSITIPQ